MADELRISDWSSDLCSSDLSFIAPLIALYLAALLLKEKIGGGAIVASILGLLGVAVILLGRIQGDYDREALWGAGLMLISAIFFAFNLILHRQQAQLASPCEEIGSAACRESVCQYV